MNLSYCEFKNSIQLIIDSMIVKNEKKKTEDKMSFASIKIAIICILIFMLQLIYPNLTNEFALSREHVLIHPWILITYMFLHGSVQHIFYNMFALVMFGLILESIIKSRNFLIVYFLSGIISGIISLFFYNSVIGASGAIFGIIGCLTTLRPKITVIAFGVPMPIIIASAMWIFLDIVGIIYPDNIAHMGHISGFAFGLIAGLILRKYFSSIRKREKSHINDQEIEDWENKWME